MTPLRRPLLALVMGVVVVWSGRARGEPCPDPAGIEEQAPSIGVLSSRIVAVPSHCAKSLLEALGQVRFGPTDYARVRTILQRSGVPLPPYSGWFDPPRLKPGQLPPHRRVDPLKAMLNHVRRAGPLERRVVAALSIVEALGRQESVEVASALVDFTFRLSGFAFRSQVGRSLERLGSWAVPGLLAVASRKPVDFKVDRFGYLTRKYAQYMLGVLEEGDPVVAVARADRKLKAQLLEAYGRYQVADAVPVVIARTDDEDPLVRRAARRALAAYFEGPRPRSLRRRLKLPGGRETEQRRLLYMNYRQRALYELRKELERLTGGDYDRSRRGKALVALLYQAQERHRKEVRKDAYERLRRSVAVLPPVKSIEMLDRFLADEPRPERWEGLVGLIQALAVRAAAAGLVGQARRLVLMAGLIRGPSGLDAALADAAYLHGLEAEANGRPGKARGWYLAALGYDASHEGAQRGIESLLGAVPSWGQLIALSLLILVPILFAWYVLSSMRRSRVPPAGKATQVIGREDG